MTANSSGLTFDPVTKVPLLPNEADRIIALQSYHILDTAEESDFDELTALASVICQTPIALISLIDKDRQWVKSQQGIDKKEVPKEYSFCAHTIASTEPIMIVKNLSKDERFKDNPFVTGAPQVEFYAGVPLIDKDGFGLGSLCVIDSQQRELNTEQVNALQVIARQVINKLELRRNLYEAKAANEKLFESENRFRKLVERAPVAIAIYAGPDLIIEQANEHMLNILGREADIIGKPLLVARPELESHPYINILKGVYESGVEHNGTGIKAPVRHNGIVREGYFDVTYKTMVDEQDVVTGIMVIASDVTEKVKARHRETDMIEEIKSVNEELAASNEELKDSQQYLIKVNNHLSESETRFRNLIEQSPIATATLKGREMIIDIANDLILKIWGKDRSVIGEALHIALPELKGQPFLKILDDVYTSGKPYYGNEAKVTVSHDGALENIFANFVYQPIFGDDGKATSSIMVVATDVTEQVESRKAVEEFNQRLELALDAGELGSYDVDLHTGKMFCTEQCKKNYGLDKDATFNFPDLFNVMVPEYRELTQKAIDNSIKTGNLYHAEYKVKWPDGSIHWISAHGKPRFDDHGVASRMVGVTSNITRQITARELLQKAEEKFRLMADNISQLAWMADETGYIFWYNQRWFDYTATTLDEMIGWGWQKVHHEEHVDRVTKKFQKHVKSGAIWEDTFPIKGADGKFRWFLSRAIPTKDDHGNVISWFGTNTDIDEQHNLEQRKDDFLSIASHELKTPITSLKANLQLLDRIKEKPNSPMHIKLINNANRSMEKVTTLIDDLLNVNRLTEGHLSLEKSTFNVKQMLHESCSHVRMAGKHELVVQGDETISVNADKHRVDQVLINFVNNAVKYAPDSEDIYLLVEKTGSFAKLSVKDNGPGIPPDKLPYLFERYYRVDNSGESYTGLGLGLYICAEIVKKHGGEIGVDSEIGKGSTFWFTLPLE